MKSNPGKPSTSLTPKRTDKELTAGKKEIAKATSKASKTKKPV